MSIFTNPFKKIKAGMSALGDRLPGRDALCKGKKAAAKLFPLALGRKLWHGLKNKVKDKIDTSLAESKNNAVREVKEVLSRNIDKFIFECVLRWFIYIGLILLAYIIAKAFNLRKDILVAFVILGIYSFYLIKFGRLCRWYISFSQKHGFIFNPWRIIKSYLHKAILDRVQSARNALPFFERLTLNFFGPASDKIASDITIKSLQSSELRREAIIRTGMWLGGWIIYALIYEKLFLFVTGIDFNALWEPLIWPFHVLVNVLYAR